jgi:asparagine synthase (glutamine-hydrolysing)
MRLICGVFQFNGTEVSDTLLRAMVAKMDVPRLRPSLQIWREGPVGIAVLDFSPSGSATTPLPETTHSIMAADVRLDEPNVLARTLGRDAGQNEDALLLGVLEQFGPSGLDRVLGDFAFASWNKNTQRLICARDALGVRPLAYVHQPGEFFAFSSLPRALHGSGIVPKKIDEGAVARRMVRAMRFDDTLIVGIKRLAPAHTIEVSRGGISLNCYWQIDRALLGTRKSSPKQAAYILRGLVEQAVACRLPRESEAGAHLSGGLDSSAITVLAARELRKHGRTLHAYSFLDRHRSDMRLEDETEFVRAVLEQECDIDWTPVRPPAATSAIGGLLDVDKMTALGADVPENVVVACAEKQGVGLILSGWGGDEGATFNGRGAFAELFLRGRWRELARELIALSRERCSPLFHILYSEVVCYLLPNSVIHLARRIAGKHPNVPIEFSRALSAGARLRLGAIDREGIRMVANGCVNHWRLMTSPHIAERMEVWAQTGARHGVAFAFPLLDRRVVEFSLSLPSEMFVRGGFRRQIFREAMAGILPPRVRLRHHKYIPFPGQVLDLVESKDAILEYIDSLANSESANRLLNFSQLRRQVEAFPSPEEVRKTIKGNEYPLAATQIIAVAQALAVASYLEQHGDEHPAS